MKFFFTCHWCEMVLLILGALTSSLSLWNLPIRMVVEVNLWRTEACLSLVFGCTKKNPSTFACWTALPILSTLTLIRSLQVLVYLRLAMTTWRRVEGRRPPFVLCLLELVGLPYTRSVTSQFLDILLCASAISCYSTILSCQVVSPYCNHDNESWSGGTWPL